MQKVSIRTLVLLIELFAAVLAHQCLAWVPPAQAEVIWIATEPNEPNEPPAPPPEYVHSSSELSCLAADPNETGDPPQPEPESS